MFAKTEDNDADIFTKNLNGELCAHHAKKMVMKKEISQMDTKNRMIGRVSDGIASTEKYM